MGASLAMARWVWEFRTGGDEYTVTNRGAEDDFADIMGEYRSGLEFGSGFGSDSGYIHLYK